MCAVLIFLGAKMMDLHTHTQFSDGVGFIYDNVASAEEKSLNMIGISDHIHYFTPKKFNRYVSQIKRIKEESEIVVLAGIEANINENGVDILPDLRKELDYVIASVHLWFDIGYNEVQHYLNLVKIALEDKNVDIIGHFGNIFPYIGAYPTYDDLLEIIQLAEANGKAFEISSRYKVPDLDFIKLCVKHGVKLTFGSDAHSPSDVGKIAWSVKILKKAGGTEEDLLFNDLL
jgi:putative hydrolase